VLTPSRSPPFPYTTLFRSHQPDRRIPRFQIRTCVEQPPATRPDGSEGCVGNGHFRRRADGSDLLYAARCRTLSDTLFPSFQATLGWPFFQLQKLLRQ